MALSSRIARLLAARYLRRIDAAMERPFQAQEIALKRLLREGAKTSYGKQHSLQRARTLAQFQQALPLARYDDLAPLIQRMREGEPNLLWPGRTRWFAKSSGTTHAKSKYIPVTRDVLRLCHYRGGYDTLALYIHQVPRTRFFLGKGLTLGGSHQIEQHRGMSRDGDLSAILLENIPRWADRIRTPTREAVLLADWQTKLQRIAEQTLTQRVTSLSGVPSWIMVMLQHLMARAGAQTLEQLWPQIEVFFHGGVAFTPYRDQYQRLIQKPDMRYMEIYNASEGFIALQDRLDSPDLLLMLDYGVLYEFIPMDRFHDSHPTAIPLQDVRAGVNYALVLSSTNGLWRYIIGDTVRFTSTSPYRLRITGRTKHFINAFGEEIIIDNAEQALRAACQATGASINDYTAGPIFMDQRARGSHQWIIEFSQPPSSPARFKERLDQALQQINSDYEAKRDHDTTLTAPTLTILPTGTFLRWMESRGKLGGQNKVPRLANDREHLEAILQFARQHQIPTQQL